MTAVPAVLVRLSGVPGMSMLPLRIAAVMRIRSRSPRSVIVFPEDSNVIAGTLPARRISKILCTVVSSGARKETAWRSVWMSMSLPVTVRPAQGVVPSLHFPLYARRGSDLQPIEGDDGLPFIETN
jgi:hypothetical protein